MTSDYTKITKDTNYVNLKTKLSGVEGSGLKAVGIKDSTAFQTLNTNIVEKLNNLSNGGVWNDQTSVKIQNETISGIESIIAKFEKPINLVMLTVGGHVDELKKALVYYEENVDSYNTLVDEFEKLQKPSQSSYMENGVVDIDRYNAAVRNYYTTCDSYRANLDALSTNVTNASTHISNVINTIKTLMSPQGMYTGATQYATFDYNGAEQTDIIPYEEPEDSTPKSRELTGEELEEFRQTHSIREGDDITVIQEYQLINGVEVPYYKVYTNKYDYEEDFEVYSGACINQMEKMDPALLEYLVETGTEVVILEDAFISSYNSDGYCGLYWLGSQVVQMRYPGPGGNHAMSEGLIHELGHALDHQLPGIDKYAIAYVNDPSLCDPEILSEVLTDENGNVVYWDELIQKECGAMFPCGTPEDTAKNVENTRGTPSEYIAELTKRYFVSEEERERMKAVAPESYTAFERMLAYTQKKVGN